MTMRELEFQTQVLALLTRIADSCERAELRLPDEATDDANVADQRVSALDISQRDAAITVRGKRRGKRA